MAVVTDLLTHATPHSERPANQPGPHAGIREILESPQHSNWIQIGCIIYNTSAVADARHQEVLPSANSISKYGVTQSYLCCVRETFV